MQVRHLYGFLVCCVPSGSVPVVLLVQRIQPTPVPMVCRYYDKSHFYPTRPCATQFLWGSMAQHGHLTCDDLQNNPVPYEEARDVVVSLMRGKLVVGHDVGHDLRALHCQHPPADVRDTAEHYSVERCRELGLIYRSGRLGRAPPRVAVQPEGPCPCGVQKQHPTGSPRLGRACRLTGKRNQPPEIHANLPDKYVLAPCHTLFDDSDFAGSL